MERGPSASAFLYRFTGVFKLLLIFCCSCAAVSAPAQVLTGVVVDANTGVGIAYASVGLSKTSAGTTAGADGRFHFEAGLRVPGDSLVVSCVGYNTTMVPLIPGSTTLRIELEKRATLLRDVAVRERKRRMILPWSKGKLQVTHWTIGMNTQFARLVVAPEPFAQLHSVTIAAQSPTARFRIRVYDYDTLHQQPGDELCDEVIEVSGRVVVNVPLDRYRIVLPQQKFFVAVQWLLIDANKSSIGLGTAGSSNPVAFGPGIRVRKVAPPEANCWLQLHNHTWVKTLYDGGITATVLY